MELIQIYLTYESLSEQNKEGVQTKTLQTNLLLSAYLVTHSQPNLAKYPTRNAFADAVLRVFALSSAQIKHWCCTRKNFGDDGKHYQMALKLNCNHLYLCKF